MARAFITLLRRDLHSVSAMVSAPSWASARTNFTPADPWGSKGSRRTNTNFLAKTTLWLSTRTAHGGSRTGAYDRFSGSHRMRHTHSWRTVDRKSTRLNSSHTV